MSYIGATRVSIINKVVETLHCRDVNEVIQEINYLLDYEDFLPLCDKEINQILIESDKVKGKKVKSV